ncbi:uncharacterized protein [Diadema antillarum]|uniref:uncharacterized protein n=1 Tax=Diadema antillarum TaxID=105358 RepID=UPI003A83AE1B
MSASRQNSSVRNTAGSVSRRKYSPSALSTSTRLKNTGDHENSSTQSASASSAKMVRNGIVDGFQARRKSENSPKMRRQVNQNSSATRRPMAPQKRSPSNGVSQVTSAQSSRRQKSHTNDTEINFINVEAEDRGERKEPEDNVGSRQATGRINARELLEASHESDVTKVYEIDLHAANIGTINNLDVFINLRVLDLSCNCIRNIENLTNNKDLRDLKLYDNRITAITNLERLQELCSLQLQHNKIRTIGKGLALSRKLKMLRLDSNCLGKVEARELAACSQLTYLDVSSNRLDSLSAFNALSSLEELHATHNCLRVISDLKRCRKLQELDVSNNKITDISGLKSLHNLTALRISHNQLTSDQMKAVERLRSLQTLDVSHNKITDLSSFPDQFPELEVLNAAGNKITKWRTVLSLQRCQSLSELYIHGNPFSQPDGEKPSYHQELQASLSSLEILDGAAVRRSAVSKSAPVMRPMSASSVVSARQVENQLKNSDQDLASFMTSLSTRFENLRTILSTLPSEPPSARPLTGFSDDLSIRSVSAMSSGRPGSRCNSRNRIAEAQAFASQANL